jgi:hypothetical protein
MSYSSEEYDGSSDGSVDEEELFDAVEDEDVNTIRRIITQLREPVSDAGAVFSMARTRKVFDALMARGVPENGNSFLRYAVSQNCGKQVGWMIAAGFRAEDPAFGTPPVPLLDYLEREILYEQELPPSGIFQPPRSNLSLEELRNMRNTVKTALNARGSSYRRRGGRQSRRSGRRSRRSGRRFTRGK